MLKNKKILAFLLASAMMCTAFTACGDDSDEDSSSEAVSSEAAEESAEESSEETDGEESSLAQVETQEFEEAVVAESGNAYLSMVDSQWWLQYWGSDMDYLTYNAGVVEITGDGSYTVSVTIDTDACRYDTTGDASGELVANGSEFMAVQIMDGADLFPDAIITIDSVVVTGTDGTANEMELTASSYTNTEEADVDDVMHNNIRANVYNAYVSDLPDDARSTEGLLSDLDDASAYSSTIIDNSAIGDWMTIEVNFTVSGTGL